MVDVGLIEDLVADLNPDHVGATAIVVRPDGKIKGFQIGDLHDREAFPEFITEDEFPFFMTTVIYTMDCISEWAKHKAQYETDPTKATWLRGLGFTMEGSELLRRLIEGKGILTERPPRSHNSNWYSLVENGEAIVYEVEFTHYRAGVGFTAPIGDEKYVNLNKIGWDVLENRGEKEYVVVHKDSDVRYLLRKATVEEQDRLLHPREERTEKINAWILIREDRENGGDTGA